MTTISDVARAAGVSTATVSRVLNNHPKVDPRLAASVRDAVKTLGYRPSSVARSLRTRRSRVWALVVSDIRNPFYTDMVRGVEHVAYGAGYSLVLCNAEDDPERERNYLQLAAAENVAGVICTPTALSTDISEVASYGIPVVLVDRTIAEQVADSVAIDNVAGAREAVAHLVENGYRRIACITGPLTTSTGAERHAGYRLALELAGLAVDESLLRVANFQESGGKAAMIELVDAQAPPDAVFVTNNAMTVGALHGLSERGLRIPDDVAVVGFDDMSWATLLRPRLTALSQPTYDLGAEAARLLLSRLDGYRGAARKILLSARLLPRESSLRKPSAGGVAGSA